jgi:hypothetical protein
MLKSNLSCIILMFFGVITTSCDQHELEEAVTESTAVVENAASAPVLIEESFEGISPLSLFHGKEFGTAHAFRLSANPVFAGKKVARVELRDSDPEESGGTRAEMVVIKDKMQKEMWFSFAVYLPADDFGYDSGKEIISQWHQAGGASPPAYLLIRKDKWSFEVAHKQDAYQKYDLGRVAKNKWHHFTFHFIYSNGSKGLVEIWQDGKRVLRHKGGNIYKLANLPKWKVGIYKWDWNGSQKTEVKKRVLYFDNIRAGTAKATLADMTATGTAKAKAGK